MEGLSRRNPNEEKKKYSIIHWQTGEPNKKGLYIVALDNGIVTSDWWYFDPPYNVKKMFAWVCHKGEVVAWCKMSDIEPYKEGTK